MIEQSLHAEDAIKLALDLERQGRRDEAERLYREILETTPDCFPAMVNLALGLEYAGKAEEALGYYERACVILPGHALPFTRRALLKLRRQWPPPPRPRPKAIGPRVMMTSLGMNGRFGNQLLQYAFLTLYAESQGIGVEVPDWIGRDLFALSDPLPGTALPRLPERNFDPAAVLSAKVRGPADVDFWGYFALHGGVYAPFRDRFRDLFRFSSRARSALCGPLARLGGNGGDLIAVHIRRGDFGQGPFWAAPTEWYLEWLDSAWRTFKDPILYVASDEPAVRSDFSRYDAVCAEDLWTPVPGAEFLLDFAVLTRADAIATSNSTFSGVAALLNESAQIFMRPDPDVQRLVSFDPWNAPMLLAASEQA